MPSDTANDPVQDGHVRDRTRIILNWISSNLQVTVSVGYSAAFSVDCVLLLAVKQQIQLNVEEEVVEEVEGVVKPDTLWLSPSVWRWWLDLPTISPPSPAVRGWAGPWSPSTPSRSRTRSTLSPGLPGPGLDWPTSWTREPSPGQTAPSCPSPTSRAANRTTATTTSTAPGCGPTGCGTTWPARGRSSTSARKPRRGTSLSARNVNCKCVRHFYYSCSIDSYYIPFE